MAIERFAALAAMLGTLASWQPARAQAATGIATARAKRVGRTAPR